MVDIAFEGVELEILRRLIERYFKLKYEKKKRFSC